MDLQEFLLQTQAEIKAEINERFSMPGSPYPYPETVFSEVVMKHMSDIGMTFEPEICHYSAKVGNANVRLSGFAISDENDQLDLFVSIYSGSSEIEPIPDADTKVAAEQCLRFLAKCAEGRLATSMEEANDAYALALTIQNNYPSLDQIRIYVLTDKQSKSKSFKPRDVAGKTIKLEVMDIERLHRHWSEGKPRDELVVNFEDVSGSPLPCIFIPSEMSDYDYAMTVIPGEALRYIYEKFGARLLEANVRSFLSVTGKVNKGIRDTLRDDPERFVAYNNGIVIVADELHLGRAVDGSPGISWLKGMQIVNGGQTTASIYFSKKRFPEIDLSKVRVPAKIIVLKTSDETAEEALISDVSKYANSQNSVKQSDLSANKPFHVELEKLSLNTYCPDGVGRWFYERASGSYSTLLAREGTTPAKLKRLKEVIIPTSRKITKTDLAKFINAWDQNPDEVSLGSQKNFEKFMDRITANESATTLDAATFKNLISKSIIYKRVQSLVRPMFPAFQGNVATYVVALLANRYGKDILLDKVWMNQGISNELKNYLAILAGEVNAVMHSSSGGKMVSEWAKKPECWDYVRLAKYTEIPSGVPEYKKG